MGFWLEGLERAIGWCIDIARHEPAGMEAERVPDAQAALPTRSQKIRENICSFFLKKKKKIMLHPT